VIAPRGQELRRNLVISAKHAKKTRNHKISDKIGDGILLRSASFHQEVNSINHRSKPSPTLPKRKERSSGEIANSLQDINQNLRKLQEENDKKLEILNKTTMEVDKLLESVI